MKLLAIDTCLGACSAAVIERLDTLDAVDRTDEGHAVAAVVERMATGHAERLFPLVRETLARAGVPVPALDGIAVTVGPGTFTGVRLGVAAARGLALAADLPVWTTTSLALLAAGAARRGVPIGAPVLAVADARNGQVYAQLFVGGRRAAGAPALMTANEASARVAAETWIVGSGAPLVAAEARARGWPFAGIVDDLEPDAVDMGVVPLAVADPPMPLYLRPADAKPQDGKSLPRVTAS